MKRTSLSGYTLACVATSALAAYAAEPRSEREQVKAAMAARPRDPWPRGEGHVLLARPGSRGEDKAYHEPGGSFSPGVGTFGVAVWVVDDHGDVIATSDSLPTQSLKQSFQFDNPQTPAVATTTAHYEARWQVDPAPLVPGGRGHAASLHLKPASPRTSLTLAVRSVGPAGGPIRDLVRSGTRITLDGRFWLDVNPAPKGVKLGNESVGGPSGDWRKPGDGPARMHTSDGWGYALVSFPPGAVIDLHITDTRPHETPELPVASSLRAQIETHLPDPDFRASLDAQTAHLLMSTVGAETRPGEPTNYPLAWLRDGTYTLVALTRAGHVDTARALARKFAVDDFFGGFGPEADAPGLALWALDEVAAQVGDPAFDRWLLPHVIRKAEWIRRLRAATGSVRHEPVNGALTPPMRKNPDHNLVANGARDGLIVGRMDGHRPLLFVNAVSALGLRRAAALMERAGGDQSMVRAFRAEADTLAIAWRRAYDTSERDNDRTFMSSLWPTFVAGPIRERFARDLAQRWDKQRNGEGAFKTRPLWTYFDVAESHQWLVLGDSDRTWKTLRWFWDHQSSPGLWSFWEGDGEENGFGLWLGVRGWVAPAAVTPHYWTAAELLLLQMDMLALVDESSAKPQWIVGAGVPPAWTREAMAVSGVRSRFGTLSWTWDGATVRAVVTGAALPVRLGPGFGKAPLVIDRRP